MLTRPGLNGPTASRMMTRPRTPLIGAVLVALIMVACSAGTSDYDMILEAMERMETAAEAGESGEFMGYIAADFGGDRGSLDRQALRALVLRQLNRHQRIRANVGPVRISFDHPERPLNATAEFEALLLGGGNWLPTDGQLYAFVTRWRKDEGRWLLVSADWKEGL